MQKFLLWIGLSISQFGLAMNYMDLINRFEVNAQPTVESITKESLISPEMQWAVVSLNNPLEFVINRTTGAVQNMPSAENVMNTINGKLQSPASITDAMKESMQKALQAMLEATSIAQSTIAIQSAYEQANQADAISREQLLQNLKLQETNIQAMLTRVNAVNQKSYVSWIFGSSTATKTTKSSGINQTKVTFDHNDNTIRIPAELMDSIIALNDYKQKSDATLAANLLFKQCFIAQQQHKADQIPLHIKSPLSAENYIYNNFPNIYVKYGNKFPICDDAQKLGMQARKQLLQIRQAVQTALAIAHKKSAANLGALLPQSLTSYLDGVVSELMKYDNHLSLLCKNPMYGATLQDIAQASEWSTMSKVAAGLAVAGTIAGGYYFRNEIADAGQKGYEQASEVAKNSYNQAAEAASWLTGKSAQSEKDTVNAAELSLEKALAEQKNIDTQKAIQAKKVAEQAAEQARIAEEQAQAQQKEVERLAQAAAFKAQQEKAIQSAKEAARLITEQALEQEKQAQKAREEKARITKEQVEYVKNNKDTIIETVKGNAQIAQDTSSTTMQIIKDKIKQMQDGLANSNKTIGSAGLQYGTSRSDEFGIDTYLEERENAAEQALIDEELIRKENALYKVGYNALGMTYKNSAEQAKKDVASAKVAEIKAQQEAKLAEKALHLEQAKFDEAQKKAHEIQKELAQQKALLDGKKNIASIKDSYKSWGEWLSSSTPEAQEATEIQKNIIKLTDEEASAKLLLQQAKSTFDYKKEFAAKNYEMLQKAENAVKASAEKEYRARSLAISAQTVAEKDAENKAKQMKEKLEIANKEIAALEAAINPSLVQTLQNKYDTLKKNGAMYSLDEFGQKGLNSYNKDNEARHDLSYIGTQEAQEAAYDASLSGSLNNWMSGTKKKPSSSTPISAEQSYQDYGRDLE